MKKPAGVLLLAHRLDLGGSERQMTEIAKSLDREKFTPHVGCFHPDGIRGEELRDAGIPIFASTCNLIRIAIGASGRP